jgi:hypothetical protein
VGRGASKWGPFFRSRGAAKRRKGESTFPCRGAGSPTPTRTCSACGREAHIQVGSVLSPFRAFAASTVPPGRSPRRALQQVERGLRKGESAKALLLVEVPAAQHPQKLDLLVGAMPASRSGACFRRFALSQPPLSLQGGLHVGPFSRWRGGCENAKARRRFSLPGCRHPDAHKDLFLLWARRPHPGR